MVKGLERREKQYIDVAAIHYADGHVKPYEIRLPSGRRYSVRALGRPIAAASTKVGGFGLRYDVEVVDREGPRSWSTRLWRDGDRWYVEAAVPETDPSLGTG